MREDSRAYGDNYLHFHNGCTCHGTPTVDACTERAIASRWIGKVLEIEDTYRDGTPVKCYSLISGSFDHHAKRGRYVAEVKLVAVPLT